MMAHTPVIIARWRGGAESRVLRVSVQPGLHRLYFLKKEGCVHMAYAKFMTIYM